MKKITLTASEELIKQAQAKARAEKTTLTKEFRQWLEDYTAAPAEVAQSKAVKSPVRSRAKPKPRSKPKSRAKAQPQESTLARCVNALKDFEKTLEKKL